MYDGKSASQLYGENIVPGHEGVLSNAFVGRKEWFDANPEAAAFFLEVWDCAMVQWAEHRDEIIDTYPQHFAVEDPSQAQFMKDYFGNTFDWFVESPYLTQEWIEGEEPVFDLVQEAGISPRGRRVPRARGRPRTLRSRRGVPAQSSAGSVRPTVDDEVVGVARVAGDPDASEERWQPSRRTSRTSNSKSGRRPGGATPPGREDLLLGPRGARLHRDLGVLLGVRLRAVRAPVAVVGGCRDVGAGRSPARSSSTSWRASSRRCGVGHGAGHRHPDRAGDGPLPLRAGLLPRLRLHPRQRAAAGLRGDRVDRLRDQPLGPGVRRHARGSPGSPSTWPQGWNRWIGGCSP